MWFCKKCFDFMIQISGTTFPVEGYYHARKTCLLPERWRRTRYRPSQTWWERGRFSSGPPPSCPPCRPPVPLLVKDLRPTHEQLAEISWQYRKPVLSSVVAGGCHGGPTATCLVWNFKVGLNAIFFILNRLTVQNSWNVNGLPDLIRTNS